MFPPFCTIVNNRRCSYAWRCVNVFTVWKGGILKRKVDGGKKVALAVPKKIEIASLLSIWYQWQGARFMISFFFQQPKKNVDDRRSPSRSVPAPCRRKATLSLFYWRLVLSKCWWLLFSFFIVVCVGAFACHWSYLVSNGPIPPSISVIGRPSAANFFFLLIKISKWNRPGLKGLTDYRTLDRCR